MVVTVYKVKSKHYDATGKKTRYLAVRYLSKVQDHYLLNHPKEEICSIKVHVVGCTVLLPKHSKS